MAVKPPFLLPLSHQLLNIANLINCESWQIRTWLRFEAEGQEIGKWYYLVHQYPVHQYHGASSLNELLGFGF